MARAALELGVREVAKAAKVSTNTVTRLERGEGLKPRTVEAIRIALETAGVIFVEENGDGPGVRLRHSVHTEEGTGRLLFRRASSTIPPGKWHGGRPLFVLPKLAQLNAEGWFILDEPTDEDRDRATRWYPEMAIGAR